MALANNFEQTSTTTREFTLEFLEQITDNFSEEHIIGSGGYGVVYKGVLDNGEEIALKKLHHMPGLDDTQFRNEFNNLMRAQHPNIIQLVGYCYNLGHQRIKYGGEYIFALMEERVLCLEYLHGGSLDKHISDDSCGLDWHTCFKIIKGICEGLNYLHNGGKDPIYHLDLKPSNILLDKNMIPKIGDFGLSRLFPSTETYVTAKIIGTPGYMPPEYIERCEITSKFDVFSLGVIIIQIMAGDEGNSKCAHMSCEKFCEHVHENWEKRLQATMLLHTSEQVKTCIEIALRCLEVDREKRPTIAEIVDELNKVDVAESSLACQVAKNQNSNTESRGSIAFYANKSLVPFDIFSCPLSPSSTDDELHLTDGVSCNYNGRPIPSSALKVILKSPKLADKGGTTEADVEAGNVSGLVFVSERDDGLETLYIALRFTADGNVKVFSLADIFGATDFSGVRLEDSGCIGGGYSVGSRIVDPSLIYVSTKEPVQECRSPWTAVYKTSLLTGKTERLTPQGVSDLSPAVSPSGKMVAVASFQSKSWSGEVVNLKTDIYVMNVDSEECDGLGRKLLIKNGGWPSWGSDNTIFFHRSTEKTLPRGMVETTSWCVFRYNISTEETVQVTPEELLAVTPAAISETTVAVATFIKYNNESFPEAQQRHIEIFDMNASGLPPLQITQKMRPRSNYYNPFVLDGGGRIGYHRQRHWVQPMPYEEHSVHLHKVESPVKDIGLYWVFSSYPAVSKDGSKLAFLDNTSAAVSKDGSKLAFLDDTSKAVWIADSQGPRMVYKERGPNNVFTPVWNQNPDKDILYVCIGTSLNVDEPMEIYAIYNASGPVESLRVRRLTHGGFNNASPSSSPDGKKIVFGSSRHSETDTLLLKRDSFLEKGNSQFMRQEFRKKHFNLYIMQNTDFMESEEGWVTRLTNGPWIDTYCEWSPNGNWIVFLSSRGKPWGAAVYPYLVKAGDPTVVIKVMNSAGYCIRAVFSPDGRSIAVATDLAVISVDPFSLPMYMHPMRPYIDIFMADIDLDDKRKSRDITCFRRITHSRYECMMLTWTSMTTDPNAQWNIIRALRESAAALLPRPRHPDDPADMSGLHAAICASVDEVSIDLDAEDDGYHEDEQ